MQFHLVNLQRQLWSGEAEFVVAPGREGELGIAPGHAPLLTDLAAGPVEVRVPGGETEVFHISGGILEISGGEVTLLADIAAEIPELDEQEATEALEKARAEAASEGYQARIRAELAEATARLATLRRFRQRKGRSGRAH